MRIFLFSKRNIKEILRDPINLFFSLGFPLVLLALLSIINSAIPPEAKNTMFQIKNLAPGLAMFGSVFMALFAGMLLSKDRTSSFLTRLFTSPMTATDFILGYTFPMIIMTVVQASITLLVAGIFGLDINTNIILAIIITSLTSLLFIGTGLFFGSLLNEKAVGGVCGALLTNIAGWLSGVFIPIDLIGGAFKAITNILPFYHSVEAIKLSLNGDFSNIGRYPKMNLTASIVKFNPHALKLTSKYPSTTFSLDVKANISGRNLNTANGIIVLNNFKMLSPNNNYELKELKLEAGQEDHKHVVTMQSDFAQMQLVGHYSYATLPNSIANIIASKLPTLPGLPHMKPTKDNEFVLQGEINKSDWLQKLFGVSLDLEQPAKLSVSVNDHQRQMNLKAILPSFTYDGNHFEQGFISLSSPSDTLKANIRAHKISENGKGIYWDIQAKAADNKLNSVLTWNNLNGKKIYGSLDTETNFFKKEGHDAARTLF